MPTTSAPWWPQQPPTAATTERPNEWWTPSTTVASLPIVRLIFFNLIKFLVPILLEKIIKFVRVLRLMAAQLLLLSRRALLECTKATQAIALNSLFASMGVKRVRSVRTDFNGIKRRSTAIGHSMCSAPTLQVENTDSTQVY